MKKPFFSGLQSTFSNLSAGAASLKQSFATSNSNNPAAEPSKPTPAASPAPKDADKQYLRCDIRCMGIGMVCKHALVPCTNHSNQAEG